MLGAPVVAVIEPPLIPQFDPTYELMVQLPPDEQEALDIAQAQLVPECVPAGVGRGDAGLEDPTAASAITMSCPSLFSPTTALAEDCDWDGPRSKVWITFYMDAAMVSHGWKGVTEANRFYKFLSATHDGEWTHSINQPSIGYCLHIVSAVPSSINGGVITRASHLSQLIAYESQFGDAAPVIIVLGHFKIESQAKNYGLTVGGPISSSMAAAYYSYPADDPYWGLRIGIHEMGHAWDAGHSDCTTLMAEHAFLHTMSLSSDRDPSCDFFQYHNHFTVLKGPDSNVVKDDFAAWLAG